MTAATFVYSAYVVACQRGEIDVETDTLRVQLVDSGYTASDTDSHLDDVPSGARVDTALVLTSVAVAADGRVLADDVTFTAVPSGDTVTGLVVYQDTGTEATSVLIAAYDRQSDTSTIAWATTGGDIEVRWPAGRVLKL